MAVFTYDTGRLKDVDIGDDHHWLVSVEHEGSSEPHSYLVASDLDPEFGSGRSSLSDLLGRIGQRVWLKYRVRKVWNEDGTSRTERVLMDVDDIGDVMDAKSRFWEWSLLPTVGVCALIIAVVLAFSGLGPVSPAIAETRSATFVYAHSDVDGNTEIIRMEYPNGAVENVSNNGATDHSPALSPDGNRVAFVSDRDTSVENVWVMDADGTNARSISFLSVIGSAQSKDPAWSPDGSTIAFSSTRYGTSDIWMATADGLNTWSVTWDSKVDSAPAFSTDGTRLFFSADGRIVSTALDGSDRQELTDPGAVDALDDTDVSLAPNGTHAAFWRYSYHTGSHLMVMRTDGSEQRELQTGEGVARQPAWLPDSTGLVFASDKDRSTRSSGARTDLYSYNLNDDQITRLTRSGKDFGQPSVGVGEIEIPDPGGSGVQSETPPTSSFYFAEGTVRPGFVQYFTIQNPGGAPASVLVEYQAANDAGSTLSVPSQNLTVPANTRMTVNLNDYLASSQVATPANVSAKITSDSEIVAERAMYFSFDPGLGRKVDGGTAVMGASGPALNWKFAEGTVRPGFVQYFTIQNPGNQSATVTIAYQATTDGGTPIAVPAQQVTIPAGTRSTVNVNHYFSASGVTSPVNVSAAISSNVPVVSERPMYYSADPGLGTTVDGGTVVVGKAG